MSEPKEKKTGRSPKKQSSPVKKRGAKDSRKKPTLPKKTAGEKKSGGKKPSTLTTQQKILRGLYIALTVISAIIVLAYIGVNLFAAPPSVGGDRNDPNGITEVTRPPMVTQYVDEDTGELIEVEIPGLSSDRKKEFYTFLVVGQSQDSGGKLSDSMMMVAYDVPNQKLSVMNLPRDTWVRYNGRTMMINAVYNSAGGDKDGKGIKGLKTAVKDLTGVYPDFHVIIQWEALGELVDAIGGVYFDVPFDMYYNDLSQHFVINVKKGYHLLNGDEAMGVVRWRQNSVGDTGKKDNRYGYADGDLGRIKTQQAFLKAVIAKCIQPEVLLGNLSEYINIFTKNVETDLSVANLAYFGKSAIGGLDMDNVTFVTLPNRNAGDGAHLLPIGSQIVSTVNEHFNPYQDAIRLGELTLATESPLVTPTPEVTESPEESGEPGEDGEDEETPAPDTSETPEPDENEEAILPPGTFTRPSSTPAPGESAKPATSSKPAASNKPSESEKPSATTVPSASNSPAASEKPTNSPAASSQPGGLLSPENTPAPTAEPTPAPAATPNPTTPAIVQPPVEEEEPVLPPM